jgi:predicted nucleotidyltransferase
MLTWLAKGHRFGRRCIVGREGLPDMSDSAIALDPRYLTQLLDIIRRTMAGCRAEVVLFGSRARGNPGPASDIDLAVRAGQHSGAVLSRLREGLEESTIPLTADVVDLESCGPALAEQVRREGIALWKS